ncbi:MAG: formate/nitrite transporter family protein [Enterococcus malodoratus]
MDDYSLLLQVGQNKFTFFQKTPMKFFVKSILAGIYLGVAMSLSLALGGIIATINPNLAKIAFAMFFGLTFVLIIFLNGELFTGNCLTTIFPIYNKKKSLSSLLKMWGNCLLGNAVGISIYSVLFIRSRALSTIIIPYLANLVEAKQHFTLESLLIKSILCNFIVCIATYVALKIKEDLAKTFIMLVVIMTFVVCGFDHCIANIGLFLMQAMSGGTALSGSLVFQNILFSIVGNVLGGSVMMAAPLYFVLCPTNLNMRR